MKAEDLAPNGLPVTDTVPVDMPEQLVVPFMVAWKRMLMDTAFRKAMNPPYRGRLPQLLGRRAYARSQGYQNHRHMLRAQQEQEAEMLRSLGHPA
jgi:hypothetical protein